MKRSWGPGPWHDEPDREEWEHAGLPCLIIRSDVSGCLCGYVGVPQRHPAYGANYDAVDVPVHGGLTFSGASDDDKHRPHEPPVWWFGFDTAHAWDVMPAVEAVLRNRGHTHLRIAADGPWPAETYKDIAYVRAETNRLAEQLRDLAGEVEADGRKDPSGA